jgi:glycosyltransferase involved in cell wall biosynthesis
MNILYISNEYPPETGYGGIGTYTKYCAEGMASRGHRVHVICRSESGQPSTSITAGVIVHRIAPGSYPLPSHRYFYPFRKLCYKVIPDSLVRLAWAKQAYKTYITEINSQESIDIVEYPECGGEGFYFSKDPALLKIARLHTPWEMVRTLDKLVQPLPDRFLLFFIEKSAARRSSGITSPTLALADIVRHRWHLSQVLVIPNPISLTSFSLTEGKDLLFLGRVEYRKGVHNLLKAYSQLCSRITPPLLRLVGKPYGKLPDGTDYGDSISHLIDSVPANGAVEWIRGANPARVIDYLRQSAIALFPSIWENFSYSCLEAMSCGLAVIASNCGGFPEMMKNGETGLLIEPNDVDEITEALVKLLSQPQEVKKIGNNARLRIEKHYTTESVCSRIETMYTDLLKRRSHE